MAEKLTLIVTCTERKSVQPVDGLWFRNLLAAPLEERAMLWRGALRKERARIPLRKLYQGDAWTQALKLEDSTRRAGFDPTLLVASAGLGLVAADEEWPAYAATFSTRHADSIGTNGRENKAWWRLITDGQRNFSDQTGSQTLLVLSETYSSAMVDDLKGMDKREDVVVFGGSPDIPGHIRIPADRGLRAALGGTTGSLNMRSAIVWVKGLNSPTLVGQRDHNEWRNWVRQARKPESYNRTLISDADVLKFVQDARKIDAHISKTRALRMLRDAGWACEQKRFSGLFSVAVKDEK